MRLRLASGRPNPSVTRTSCSERFAQRENDAKTRYESFRNCRIRRVDGVIFDIGAAGYVPKPDRPAYQSFLDAFRVRADEAAMFEDMPQNLAMPHAFGMVTVLVEARNFDHPAQRGMKDWQAPPEHVHHVTDDLTGFLGEVTGIHWPEDGADENGAD